MAQNEYKKNTVLKGGIIAFGVVTGGVLGPVLFGIPLHTTVPLAAVLGAIIGGFLGLVAAVTLLQHRERQATLDLQRAAESARREAGLPSSIKLCVHDRVLRIEGEVDDESEVRKAAYVFHAISGIEDVENRLTVVRPAGPVDPEEIRASLMESLRHNTEINAHGIHVAVDRSRVILEGKVHSWRELSVAEKVAWDMPGIKRVENRLEVLV